MHADPHAYRHRDPHGHDRPVTIGDRAVYYAAHASGGHTLRLPAPVPRWLDLRRYLWLGWVTIETPGYIASAKVHYRPSHWGLCGTRVHTLYIWRDTGRMEMTAMQSIYRCERGNVVDRLDGDGLEFFNLIMEYFK